MGNGLVRVYGVGAGHEPPGAQVLWLSVLLQPKLGLQALYKLSTQARLFVHVLERLERGAS